MYEIRTIPEQTFKDCRSCQHHDNRLLKSGRNPIREHVCTHPNFVGNNQFMSSILGKTNGKKIGNDSKTPRWCPFIATNGKRKFNQITPNECLDIAKIIKPAVFTNPKTKWLVKNADREVYDGGGYSVKSNDNWFQFDFDFEQENITLWDNKYPESDQENIDMKTHYEVVQFLNSKNIFFNWQIDNNE